MPESTGGSASGKPNVISAQGLARGDLRTLSNEQTARLEARMRAIVAEHLPGTDAEIQFDEGYPAMAPTAGNRALLARLNEINAALGLEPMAELDPLQRGAGDISFVADKVDALVGFGVVGPRQPRAGRNGGPVQRRPPDQAYGLADGTPLAVLTSGSTSLFW